MLLFWSEDHIETWCKHWNMARGAAFSLEQCWRLAHAWYSPDRRRPEWRRKTPLEAQALFAELGFSGEFWRLA